MLPNKILAQIGCARGRERDGSFEFTFPPWHSSVCSLHKASYRIENGPKKGIGARSSHVTTNPVGMHQSSSNGGRPRNDDKCPRHGVTNPFEYFQVLRTPVKPNAQATVPGTTGNNNRARRKDTHKSQRAHERRVEENRRRRHQCRYASILLVYTHQARKPLYRAAATCRLHKNPWAACVRAYGYVCVSKNTKTVL